MDDNSTASMLTTTNATIQTTPYNTVDDGNISQILLFFIFAIAAVFLSKLISFCVRGRRKNKDNINEVEKTLPQSTQSATTSKGRRKNDDINDVEETILQLTQSAKSSEELLENRTTKQPSVNVKTTKKSQNKPNKNNERGLNSIDQERNANNGALQPSSNP